MTSGAIAPPGPAQHNRLSLYIAILMNDQADNDSRTAGWDAINASLAQLYPGQEPRHAAPVRRAILGGGDPLDGISVYRSTQGLPMCSRTATG